MNLSNVLDSVQTTLNGNSEIKLIACRKCFSGKEGINEATIAFSVHNNDYRITLKEVHSFTGTAILVNGIKQPETVKTIDLAIAEVLKRVKVVVKL